MKPYRVMTRGEFAYVVNVITMERVACYPMWEGQTWRFNCDTFAPGYVKAKAKCDELNKEYENENVPIKPNL